MNRPGLSENIAIPALIGLIFLAGYLIYQSNHRIMNPEPLVNSLRAERAESGLDILVTEANVEPRAKMQAAELPSLRLNPADEATVAPVAVPEKDGQWLRVKADRTLVFYNTRVAIHGADGALVWAFELKPDSKLADGIVGLGSQSVWFSAKDGRTFSLELETGKLLWARTGEEKILHQPILFGDELLIVAEAKSNQLWSGIVLNAKTGESLRTMGPFELPMAGSPVLGGDRQTLYYTTTTGHIDAVDLKAGTMLWSAEGSPSFKAAPAVEDRFVLAVNEDGVVLAHDPKTGKKLWDVELKTPIHAGLNILPELNIANTKDLSGYVIAVDLRERKRKWRHATQNLDSNLRVEFVRLTGTFAGIAAEAKRYLVAAPCQAEGLCFFDPTNGYLANRLNLGGKVMSGPRFAEDGFIVDMASKNGLTLKKVTAN